MKKPNFSIIIPVYNTEQYLEECLFSAINQTYYDLEIICINDGSSDDSLKILNRYKQQDSRIIIINQNLNSGPGHARNKGLEVVKGEYVLFLDSDDYLDLNTLKIIHDSNKLFQVDILVYNGKAFDHASLRMYNRKYNYLSERFFKDNYINDKYMLYLVDFHSPCMKVYKTSFLKENSITFPESIVGEDVEFWMKCLINARNINYIDLIGYYRRYRKGSIMTSNVNRNIKDRVSNFNNLMTVCSSHTVLYNYIVGVYIPFNVNKAYSTQDEKLIEYTQSIYNMLIKNITKMEIPKISVVMPAYNASPYIAESIESIINQTFVDIELIIVNDGSTDDTVSIINSFNDNRIRLIHNKHDFIGSLNLGLSNAKGKYIARMDADDIMLPERLQVQYEFMESNPATDVSGTWLRAFGDAENEMRKGINHISLQLQAITYTPVYHPSVIFKKEIIQQFPCLNGVYQVYDKEYIYVEDYKLWVCLLMKGYRFANIPQVLVLYRRSNTQVTSVRKVEMEPTILKIKSEYLEYVMEQIIEKDEDFYEILNNSIELYNSRKLNFGVLQQIVHMIYSETLCKNR